MFKTIKFKLCALMFIQFFVYGATVPIISLYFKAYMHFSDAQTGIILAISSLAAFISPFITTFIADRIMSAERLLVFCNLAASILAIIMSFIKPDIYSLNTYWVIFLIMYTLYTICIIPTSPLITAITFHNYSEKRHNFGNIRVWGTIGWIAVAWFLGFILLKNNNASNLSSKLPLSFRLAGITSIIIAFYALTFPQRKDLIKKNKCIKVFPVDSFNVIKNKNIIILFVISYLVIIIDKFYYYGSSPFLKQLGVAENNILPIMSLGQIPEIFVMFIVGSLVLKFGYKKIVIIGIFFQCLRFICFSIKGYFALTIIGTVIHGFTYSLIFVPLSIYLDHFCSNKSRTGVHQLYSMNNSGLGSFSGNFLAGLTAGIFLNKQTRLINFSSFWIVPFIISFIILLFLLIFFKNINSIKKPSAFKEID